MSGKEGRGHYRTAFVSVTAEAALALSFMRGAWAGLQPLLALFSECPSVSPSEPGIVALHVITFSI